MVFLIILKNSQSQCHRVFKIMEASSKKLNVLISETKKKKQKKTKNRNEMRERANKFKLN